jgi:hypothetical protein
MAIIHVIQNIRRTKRGHIRYPVTFSFNKRQLCVTVFYRVQSIRYIQLTRLQFFFGSYELLCWLRNPLPPLLKLTVLYRVLNTANIPVHSQLKVTHTFINCKFKMCLYFYIICKSAAPH